MIASTPVGASRLTTRSSPSVHHAVPPRRGSPRDWTLRPPGFSMVVTWARGCTPTRSSRSTIERALPFAAPRMTTARQRGGPAPPARLIPTAHPERSTCFPSATRSAPPHDGPRPTGQDQVQQPGGRLFEHRPGRRLGQEPVRRGLLPVRAMGIHPVELGVGDQVSTREVPRQRGRARHLRRLLARRGSSSPRRPERVCPSVDNRSQQPAFSSCDASQHRSPCQRWVCKTAASYICRDPTGNGSSRPGHRNLAAKPGFPRARVRLAPTAGTRVSTVLA